jgi:Domain of unknown function (DUF4783)
MKNYLGLILLSSLFIFSSFSSSVEMNSILTALKAGNANMLSKYFDNRVDLSLPDKSDNYSKTQAEMVMKDFFNNNKVKNFSLKHSGEKNGSTYCVGVLVTRNGNYRTTLFMKQKGDRDFVQEINFQPEQ